MKRIILGASCLGLLVLTATALQAQDIEDLVASYKGENGKGYMQPLDDAFGAALNSGLYHTARIDKNGLHVQIGVVAMAALIGDDQKTFQATTQDQFRPQQTVSAPTIFGSTEGASVTGDGGTVYLFPGGMAIKRLPLAVPQATVGSIMGTEATIRFIQVDLDDNFEQLKLVGFGVRHSLSQYLKDFPVDLAASLFTQSFDVGDIVEARATYFGLQASRSASLLTIYGGLGLSSSKMDIQYEYDSETEPETISFELKSGTKFRANAGLALILTPVVIHADYNLGSPNTLALGLGFGF
jgi:hypothetical protein